MSLIRVACTQYNRYLVKIDDSGPVRFPIKCEMVHITLTR